MNNSIIFNKPEASVSTITWFCLHWHSLCTDLVSPNKTETHIELYVSFEADICFTRECKKSEGTDILFELEK